MAALPQLPSLSVEQQALLLAALESNRRTRETNASMSRTKALSKPASQSTGSSRQQQSQSPHGNSSAQATPATTKSGLTFGDNLFGEFFESTPTFDVDFPTTNDDYFNDYTSYAQDDSSNGETAEAAETGEKRKSPGDDDDDDDDDEDGEAESGKRHEGDDKTAKKPGRKLITTEPTTKRKAQNRAAQRAFRERKEKHLKDLEVKVFALEKQTETKSTENTALRAQIDRLQTELKEYKKRLSTTSTSLSTSPKNRPSSGFGPNGGLKGLLSDFQFDFTKFGDTSNDPAVAMPLFGNAAFQSPHSTSGLSINATQPTIVPSTSNGYNGQLTMEALNSQSNKDESPFAFTSATFHGLGSLDYGMDNFDSPPELANTTSQSSSSRHASQSHQSHPESNADSPGSSAGLTMGVSSTGTSPEPAPQYTNDPAKSFADLSYDNSFFTNQYSSVAPPSQNLYDFSSVDWLSHQNGGQFDPQLFSEYRESQAAVVGDDAFKSGLFDDPYNFGDLGAAAIDSANFNLTTNVTTNDTLSSDITKKTAFSKDSASVTQRLDARPTASLMEQMDRCCNGETAREPPSTTTSPTPQPAFDINKIDMTNPAYYMTTQKLWHELQTCPKFLSGDLDIDTLCSELSAKATCSETGMQVPKDVVEKVLWRLAGVPEDSSKATAEQVKVQQWTATQASNDSARKSSY